MLIRNGKFGDFYYCPNSTPTNKHGTISVLAWAALSGNHGLVRHNRPIPPPDIDFEVRRQMASFGAIPNELDLFVEGPPEDDWGDMLDYSDEPDHWSNMRPY